MSPHDYDLVRRQLDSLLGPDRNKLPGEDARLGHPQFVGYSDPSLCKGYLLGLCLSTLSVKRRGYMMSCNKVHSDEARREFEEADRNGLAHEKRRWQQDLADECRVVVNDEDRRIQGAAHRLKQTYGFEEPASAVIVRDLSVLQSLGLLVNGVPASMGAAASDDDEEGDSPAPESTALTTAKEEGGDGTVVSGDTSMEIRIIGGESAKKSESRGIDSDVRAHSSRKTPATPLEAATETEIKNDAGSGDEDVKDAPALVESVALLSKHRIGEEGGVGPGGLLLNKSYKQRVCGQCGGLFSLYDAETRLASHFSGKQHTSLVALREKLRQLEETLRGGYNDSRRRTEGGRTAPPRPPRNSGHDGWDSRGRRPRSRSPRRGPFGEDRESGGGFNFPVRGPVQYGGSGRRGGNDRALKRHRGDPGQARSGRHHF